MDDLVSEIREACARVAERARHVRIVDDERISTYAETLSSDPPDPTPDRPDRTPDPPDPTPDPPDPTPITDPDKLCAFWLTLDAINFGSGWFPTLRKRPGRSGYFTIASGLRDRFDQRGPWDAAELVRIHPRELAVALGQDPAHALIGLFAASLRDVGRHVLDEHAGSFAAVPESAGSSAVALAQRLGGWSSFADSSRYDGFAVPFFKRAQIAAADLSRAGAADFDDLHRLTMFADNLVPHVLRIDGVLRFDAELIARIERGELIGHGSPEEVEIRACALHAVELMAAGQPGTSPAELDELLWNRGQLPRYKARPRHRSRCTAY